MSEFTTTTQIAQTPLDFTGPPVETSVGIVEIIAGMIAGIVFMYFRGRRQRAADVAKMNARINRTSAEQILALANRDAEIFSARLPARPETTDPTTAAEFYLMDRQRIIAEKLHERGYVNDRGEDIRFNTFSQRAAREAARQLHYALDAQAAMHSPGHVVADPPVNAPEFYADQLHDWLVTELAKLNQGRRPH